MNLTPRQTTCLAYLTAYIDEHGYAPTYAEIKKAMGWNSASNVHYMVHALAERGVIKVGKYKQRSITLVVDERLARKISKNLKIQGYSVRPEAIEIAMGAS